MVKYRPASHLDSPNGGGAISDACKRWNRPATAGGDVVFVSHRRVSCCCAEPPAHLSNLPTLIPGRSAVPNLASIIATELAVRDVQVQAAIDLLDGGATVPFI